MNTKARPDYLIFVVMAVLVFIMAARAPLDSDLLWHIRSGEVTLERGTPLVEDVFSYTKAGESWVNHSWLSQLGMALLYRLGGWFAVGAAMAILVTIGIMLAWPQMKGPAFWRSLVILLGCLVSAPVWTPRPQLTSFVLFSLLGFLLFQYKWKHAEVGPLIPPVFLVWSNLHGGYALGAVLIGCLIFGEMINNFQKKKSREVISWPRLGRLVGWSALGGALVVVNPNSFQMWGIPFQTVGVESLQRFIQEWASPDFHAIEIQPMLWLLFALLFAFALGGHRVDATDLVTVIVFGYMAFLAQRNFGPFALVGMPVLARYGWRIIQPDGWDADRGWTGEERRRRPKWQRLINLVLVGFLMVVGMVKLMYVTSDIIMNAHSQSGNPTNAVNYLKTEHPAGHILSEYNWGGYLIWTLPEYPVFVDGRTDLFGDEVIGQWIEVVQAGPRWEAILQDWDVRLILLSPNRPVINLLPVNGWVEIYQDELSVLFQHAPW